MSVQNLKSSSFAAVDNVVVAGGAPKSLQTRASQAAIAASAHAARVDAEAIFPKDAMDAIRAERLLGIMIPAALGGEGASMSDVAGVCYRLGTACSSTALIYAMHQVKIACIVRHGLSKDGAGHAWRQAMLRKTASGQLLLSSSTTEGANGGNIRSSDAAVVRDGTSFTYDRNASVISYGAFADGLVTTARRAPDAVGSDQVLVVLMRDDYTLEQRGGWETMGMRGTCSWGFGVSAKGVSDQILDEPYSKIHSQTMMPAAHLLWSSAWAGIAAAAVEQARLYTRNAIHQSGGALPPGVKHLTQAKKSLASMLNQIRAGLAAYEAASGNDRALASTEFQTSMTLLKVEASELAVATTMSAMRACGLAGYRNDSEYTVGRLLRDAMSAPLMINNDRILEGVGASALLSKVPSLV